MGRSVGILLYIVLGLKVCVDSSCLSTTAPCMSERDSREKKRKFSYGTLRKKRLKW